MHFRIAIKRIDTIKSLVAIENDKARMIFVVNSAEGKYSEIKIQVVLCSFVGTTRNRYN